MDKELARQLAYIYQQASGLLVHTIWLMEHHGTEAQLQEHRKAVAQVLTELGAELLYPIYHEYPDLEPPSPTPSDDHEGDA
ncbi:MAG: hypothetical protein IPM54_45210 [Polyangiaceae bacterium]|nr:hypothetical protein [Polyangiaceae bacterium]